MTSDAPESSRNVGAITNLARDKIIMLIFKTPGLNRIGESLPYGIGCQARNGRLSPTSNDPEKGGSK
jgi:hypothetical protein